MHNQTDVRKVRHIYFCHINFTTIFTLLSSLQNI